MKYLTSVLKKKKSPFPEVLKALNISIEEIEKDKKTDLPRQYLLEYSGVTILENESIEDDEKETDLFKLVEAVQITCKPQQVESRGIILVDYGTLELKGDENNFFDKLKNDVFPIIIEKFELCYLPIEQIQDEDKKKRNLDDLLFKTL